MHNLFFVYIGWLFFIELICCCFILVVCCSGVTVRSDLLFIEKCRRGNLLRFLL